MIMEPNIDLVFIAKGADIIKMYSIRISYNSILPLYPIYSLYSLYSCCFLIFLSFFLLPEKSLISQLRSTASEAS